MIPAHAGLIVPSESAVDPVTLVGWAHFYWAESLAYSNGADVNTWDDLIGSDDLAAFGSVGNIPTMVVSDASFNNHRSVRFNPSTAAHVLQIAAASASGPHAQPYTIVCLFKCDSIGTPGNATGNAIFDGGSTAHEGRLRLRNPGSGNRYAIFAGGTEANATTTTGVGAPDTNVHLALVHFNGSSSRVEIDGTTIGSSLNPGSEQWDGVLLGQSQAGSTSAWWFTGRHVLLGVYWGDAETDGGWSAFKAWLLSYYGHTVA